MYPDVRVGQHLEHPAKGLGRWVAEAHHALDLARDLPQLGELGHHGRLRVPEYQRVLLGQVFLLEVAHAD